MYLYQYLCTLIWYLINVKNLVNLLGMSKEITIINLPALFVFLRLQTVKQPVISKLIYVCNFQLWDQNSDVHVLFVSQPSGLPRALFPDSLLMGRFNGRLTVGYKLIGNMNHAQISYVIVISRPCVVKRSNITKEFVIISPILMFAIKDYEAITMTKSRLFNYSTVQL